MFTLLGVTYDLADYATVRAVGILATLIVVCAVLYIAYRLFRRTKDREFFSELREEGTTVNDAKRALAETEPAATDVVGNAAETEPEPPSERAVLPDEPSAKASVFASAPAYDPADPALYPDETPAFITEIEESLSEEASDAFRRYIVKNEDRVVSRIAYPLINYAEEKEFLRDFFLSADKFAKRLPCEAFETLSDRYQPFLRNVYEKTRLNMRLINVYYARRKLEDDAFDKCYELCKEDVELNLNGRRLRRGVRVPSLKKLVLIHTARKEYEEAVALCETAIARRIYEKKNVTYEARRDRLLPRREKQRRREERARRRAERDLLRQRSGTEADGRPEGNRSDD